MNERSGMFFKTLPNSWAKPMLGLSCNRPLDEDRPAVSASSPTSVAGATMIHDPLTKLQCSPTSDGAAAAIVASERFVDEHDLWDQAIEIAGQSMVTDLTSTFDSQSSINVVGADMSRTAGEQALAEAEVGIDEVDVVELHDGI